MKTLKRANFFKSTVVYIGSLIFTLLLTTTARSQILNFNLLSGQLIFYVRHKQFTIVEIYDENTFPYEGFELFLFCRLICVLHFIDNHSSESPFERFALTFQKKKIRKSSDQLLAKFKRH